MNNFEYANATDDDLLDWEAQAYEDERQARQWDQDCAQILWAEAGGYAAGLPRPIYKRD